VPGGGPSADVIREYDRLHQLGEERAHWLALRVLQLNAHFLAELLGGVPVVDGPEECGVAPGSRAILDAHTFARSDETRPGRLPHTWKATSDSLAARAARVGGAARLVLLKSVSLPSSVASWSEAAQLGLVDPLLAQVVGTELQVSVVNLRTWTGG
jgi:aspartokinase-like uncharacterized kinase